MDIFDRLYRNNPSIAACIEFLSELRSLQRCIFALEVGLIVVNMNELLNRVLQLIYPIFPSLH
jgi:hypothetical protein